MPWCKTCKKEVTDDLTSLFPQSTNYHVQAGHEVLINKPHLKFDIIHFINHNLVEPVIWAISAYGIVLGIFASFTYGFFTLKEYSLGSLVFFLTPTQVQNLDLWYDAYPYSLIIFGSYLLSLYLIFNRQHKGYLAMPVFLITYATWDFLGIGTHFIYGVNIIWLGIALLSLIYYFPLRKQFSVNISFPGLLLFFGLGILDLQNIFLHLWPFTDITIVNMGVSATILQYFNGISNELTFCIFCLLSIKLKN
jgi:hypothetical protein